MAVEDFDSDWEINWGKRLISCIAPRKEAQYTVTDFWRWARKMEASSTGMAYPHIVDTDGMGASYNVPRKVRLANEWKIAQESVKYLKGTDSTLLSENNQVLIPDSLRENKWWENGYVQAALIVLAVVGVLVAFI